MTLPPLPSIHRIWLLALLSGLGCANTALAFDCGRLQLNAEETIDSYLSDYNEHCAPASVAEQLARFGLPGEVQALNARELLNAYPAWECIRASLWELRNESKPPITGSATQMAGVFAQLHTRADAAVTDLKILLDTGSAPDVSVLGFVAWDLIDLELPAVPGSHSRLMSIVAIHSALLEDCPAPDGPLCAQTIAHGRTLMDTLGLARRLAMNFSKSTVSTIRQQIDSNEARWTTYLYDSKPMLPLDFVVTDWLSGGWQAPDPFSGGFRSPPRTQWFLLHPSAGVEYSSAAADGDQLQPTLILEVIGANRWDPNRRWIDWPGLRHLSGAALTVSYADRAGIRDTGYGLMLTFSNVYSIGAARYGGTTGVFLSIDLANLFRDKYRPRYEKYKEKLRSL